MDDLIKRLRSVDVSWSHEGELCAWAADRIETLETVLLGMTKECSEHCIDQCESDCGARIECRLFQARAALGEKKDD